jgi:hypothetical protein
MQRTKTIVLSIIALIAIGFFGVLINRYVLQSQAGTSKAIVEFNPADGQKIPEEEPIKFIIKPEKAGEKISGVDMSVDVKNGQFIAWQDCAALDDDKIKFDDLKSETKGATARKSCVVLQQASSLPQAVVLAGTVACTGKDPVTVTINTTNSTVVGPVEGTSYVLGGATSVTYSCDGTTKPDDSDKNAEITAKFDPSSCDIKKDETCKYNLDISAVDQKNKISGFYVKMTYDNKVMKGISVASDPKVKGAQTSVLLAQAATPTPCASIVCPGAPVPTAAAGAGTPVPPAPTTGPATSITPAISVSPSPVPSGTPGAAGCSIANSKIDDKAGTIEMLYTCKGAASSLPTSISSSVSLKGIADGAGTLAMSQIQVSGPGRTSAYSVNKNNATYNVGAGGTGGGTGDVELDVTLRLQCIVKKPKAKDTVKVKVGIGDGGLKEPVFQTLDFKVDDKGFWHAKAKFNVKPGGGYKILPKGEYHMQKKVCSAKAKEDFPGAYSCDKGGVTLKKGTNEIDLSGIVLLTGDIPPGEQDGISNAKDQSLVRNLIGKRDAESASLADINFDGVVNAVDHACMIAALSVRYDDQ